MPAICRTQWLKLCHAKGPLLRCNFVSAERADPALVAGPASLELSLVRGLIAYGCGWMLFPVVCES